MGYYKIDKKTIEQRKITEKAVCDIVNDIREDAPGIGSYKLFLMFKDIYRDKMIGRDKFYKLMQKHNLMLTPLRRRHTTNSNHNYHKYKNLIKGLKVVRPNRLWVADITYIDTDSGVCYLHLLTDAYTHEIIGWTVSDSLKAVNTIMALDMAIEQTDGADLSKLIHHSDRGSQYCCNAYIERLNEIKASISMTEDYKPTDNAIAERVNGIVKQEWLYKMKRPADLEDARKIIARIIEFYNNRRPHMSNKMMTPRQKREEYKNEHEHEYDNEMA